MQFQAHYTQMSMLVMFQIRFRIPAKLISTYKVRVRTDSHREGFISSMPHQCTLTLLSSPVSPSVNLPANPSSFTMSFRETGQ